MYEVLILTQGRLAEVLLAAARTIAGETPGVSALALEWSDSFEVAKRKLEERLAEAGDEASVLILTDMYGGTPFNVARELAASYRIEIVTGVNLPMVLRLSCRDGSERTLEELAEWIGGKGRRAISRCTEVSGEGGEGRL